MEGPEWRDRRRALLFASIIYFEFSMYLVNSIEWAKNS
jgi:hypothetical protein